MSTYTQVRELLGQRMLAMLQSGKKTVMNQKGVAVEVDLTAKDIDGILKWLATFKEGAKDDIPPGLSFAEIQSQLPASQPRAMPPVTEEDDAATEG